MICLFIAALHTVFLFLCLVAFPAYGGAKEKGFLRTFLFSETLTMFLLILSLESWKKDTWGAVWEEVWMLLVATSVTVTIVYLLGRGLTLLVYYTFSK